jgi:5-methylcytosine-specific restriction endonuclease McrA
MTRKKINSLASTAQRKALINWSKIVRNRDGNKCVVCKTTEHLNAHHILEKRYYGAIKYDPNVGVTVCAKCHLFSKYSAHKNGVWFTLWLQENRPEQYDWILKNL